VDSAVKVDGDPQCGHRIPYGSHPIKCRLDPIPRIDDLELGGAIHLDRGEAAVGSGLSGGCCVSRTIAADPGVWWARRSLAMFVF